MAQFIICLFILIYLLSRFVLYDKYSAYTLSSIKIIASTNNNFRCKGKKKFFFFFKRIVIVDQW